MLNTAKKASPRWHAFTLVELLVVIAIVGVLVALLLPAIQAARESARRSQCQNNLRQTAVGLNSHTLSQNAFPAGCLGCSSGKREMNSWNAQLLPYLEQEPLAREYRLESPSYFSPNRELGAIVLPVFLCPSTIEDRLHSESGLWRGQAFTDYGGIYGVEGEGHDAEPAAEIRQFLADRWLGVFLFDEPVKAAQISDGLSHTVSVAERITRRASASEWTSGHNIFAQQKDTPLNQNLGFSNEIGSPHLGGALLAFCDSHVDYVSNGIEQQVLNAMLTKAGGEIP